MKEKLLRGTIYVCGLLILALGITLNTKTGLGVSPIVSVPFVASQIGGWSIGNATLVSYIVFMLLQLVLKRKKYKVLDLLQLPLSIVFTRFMNLFSDYIPLQTVLPMQLLFLLLAVVLTGIGAAMSLDMRLIPNPGDGAVQAISDFSGREMGLCKNWFDGLNVAIALMLGFSLRRRVIGVGVGTLAAIFGIGRVIAVFNKLFLPSLQRAAGMKKGDRK